MSRDDEVIRRRGFGPIEDDRELIERAKELTNGWMGGPGEGRREFRTYHLGTYYNDEPFYSLTEAEFKRLKELQEIEQEKYDDLYEWKRFEGRPLSEEVIIRFLDRSIDQAEKQWGKGSFWYEEAVKNKERVLQEWREGKVVQVDMVPGGYHEEYLYSDGTIREANWGD